MYDRLYSPKKLKRSITEQIERQQSRSPQCTNQATTVALSTQAQPRQGASHLDPVTEDVKASLKHPKRQRLNPTTPSDKRAPAPFASVTGDIRNAPTEQLPRRLPPPSTTDHPRTRINAKLVGKDGSCTSCRPTLMITASLDGEDPVRRDENAAKSARHHEVGENATVPISSDVENGGPSHISRRYSFHGFEQSAQLEMILSEERDPNAIASSGHLDKPSEPPCEIDRHPQVARAAKSEYIISSTRDRETTPTNSAPLDYETSTVVASPPLAETRTATTPPDARPSRSARAFEAAVDQKYQVTNTVATTGSASTDGMATTARIARAPRNLIVEYWERFPNVGWLKDRIHSLQRRTPFVSLFYPS